VERFHFDIRKHLVEFDDVVNKHREMVYSERKKVLSGADLKANILDMLEKEINSIIDEHVGTRTNDEWDMKGLVADLNAIFPVPRDAAETLVQLNPGPMKEKVLDWVYEAYDQKEQATGPEDMRLLERFVMLRVIDDLWVEHLTEMENQRTQAGFAGLQQMKSEDSYKRIGFQQFQVLLDNIRQEIARMIFHVNLRREDDKKVSTPVSRAAGAANSAPKTAPRVAGKKVGRNDPCPCGSGKKYKHCCGK